MYLKSLILTGFKSFGRKAELSFTTSITAIVGPNGSGKSNVAEAFRFVLGEQSIKSMRGKKGEDLIFNGGNSSSRTNRASVKLIFDNSSKFLNVDFDDVAIERVVHRDGVNEYFINDSKVRLRDIAELLSQAHIGASGHHIISQGEADRILNASNRERREMIEDALGLKVYQYKRTESERKLEKTEENIKSVQSLRREIAPHIKFLAKQIEKLEKARVLEVELLEKYKVYLKREDSYLKHEKKEIDIQYGPLTKKKDDLSATIAEMKKIIAESETSSKDENKIIVLEEEVRTLAKKKDDCMRKLGHIEGALDALLSTVKKERVHDGVIQKRPTETFVDTIFSLLKEAQSLNDIQGIQEKVHSIFSLVKEFKETHLAHAEEKDINLEEKIGALEKEKGDIDKTLQTLATDEHALKERMNALRLELKEEQSTARESERTLFEAMTTYNEVSLALSQLMSRKDNVKRASDAFDRELEEGSVLLGRDVLTYPEYDLGESNDAVTSEPREKQIERARILERLKIRLEDMGTGGGDDIRKEYSETVERDTFLEKEIHDLEASALHLRELIDDLSKKLEEEFTTGITKINERFGEFFSLMFGGGRASIKTVIEKRKRRRLADELLDEVPIDGELVEEEEVEKGIEVSVLLPHKKIKGLMMLSGGERALTSIALLFAISQVKPPPFVILDETDAALDEANSKKYGDMISALSAHSQLILITHNRETMSRAGVLYGITMSSDGVSRLLSVRFDEAIATAK